uniref:Retrotransposon gag domain-containing protein n=1 Tax=Tanacetum cinerariifolium TaxID=118510 RepID=A0A699KN24_TANCI|nr:hypothetical protein [Tanacetum cinerariifolium]
MDVDANEERDGPEWILPYEGVDPLNPSPPASDFETEIEAAPMSPSPIPANPEPEAEAATVSTGKLEPLTGYRLFTNTQVSLGSSSSTAAGHDPKDLAPSRIRSDLNALHHRKHLPPYLHYQEVPYVPPSAPVVPVTHDDPRDLYVAARDAATAPATDDDDPATRKETSPSEPQESPPQMVFGISECADERKVKFAAATLKGRALTWWNSQVATRGLEAPNRITRTEMKKLMTEEFCHAEEIQRMEHELWNLKVKDFNMSAYTQLFHELTLLCPEMVPMERKKIDAYIR